MLETAWPSLTVQGEVYTLLGPMALSFLQVNDLLIFSVLKFDNRMVTSSVHMYGVVTIFIFFARSVMIGGDKT